MGVGLMPFRLIARMNDVLIGTLIGISTVNGVAG
jgi:hypothetical protein